MAISEDLDSTLATRKKSKVSKQHERQRAIAKHILSEGSVKIEALSELFEISLMTIHRDLDELEGRGLIRKSRGWVTAMSSSVVEASDVFRMGQEHDEKESLVQAVLPYIWPGQSLFLDDSTTTAHLAPLLGSKAPMTVITNYLTLMNELVSERDVTVLGLGGRYMNWSSSFLGSMTTTAIRSLRADTFIMSTSAVTDGICFHHAQETVDVKRAMFESSSKRILLVDHTKFERRALHALARLDEFDHVIVDQQTPHDQVARLRDAGVDLVVAEPL